VNERLRHLTGLDVCYTIYCTRDPALEFSKRQNRGVERLGYCSDIGQRSPVPNLDWVEVRASLTGEAQHSYYVMHGPTLSDIRRVAIDGPNKDLGTNCGNLRTLRDG
jgi:hypothetical protein